MTNLLIKFFIRDRENTTSPKVRTAYGTLSGAVGILVNILLSIAKLIIGSISHSIAITGDALNNLSDAASSAISLLGFRISSKPADEKHPYGHGRLEYLCGLAVAVIIMFMGLELIKSSAAKIFAPEKPEFSLVAIAVLVISILGKLWLALFNRKIGNAINSDTVDAVVKDSLSDIAATTASILSLILSQYFSLPFDGIFGVIVSLFVLWAGIGVFRNTSSSLLGQQPEPETVKMIEEKILSYEGVYGVHDLIVHDYGPGRCFVTAHAEVPSDTDIMVSHDLMDVIEQDFKRDTSYVLTLHMDPVVMDDEKTNNAKEMIAQIIAEIHPSLSFHDFRMVSGPHHTNLIFDVVIPFSVKLDSKTVVNTINDNIHKKNEKYYAVITIDHSYT
ncbi:MAG: cation diffusion facilitator family transporter [Acutalibacteraceae bacterium]|nr:cation diffusion facilitator family transporter [Acutalibacteraceae bacterium]